ncbi:hypothetical protein GCM10011586_14850 [Silvibacterium dinghuense]|nr:hypothetical protein GCM10011586_14850 [Silvibacterium dinghuense]
MLRRMKQWLSPHSGKKSECRGNAASITKRCFAPLLAIAFTALLAVNAMAQTVTVTNVPENGYQYNYFPGNCPSGYDIPSGQYPSTNHLEREHVIYNKSTGEWVLYAHYDNSSYTVASVLVATSTNECGPYTVQSEFQPLGLQSRDETVFEDDDGSAYLISASNKDGGANDTMAVFKLTSDYLSVDPSAGYIWLFEGLYREAPAVAKSNGTYFLITSQAAGWYPSQGGYAASTAMMSGWSALQDLGNTSTYGGQSADILTIKGTRTNAYVLVLDHLGGNSLTDTGSMWLPLLLDGKAQTATLNWYSSWQVDTKTGILTLPNNENVARNRPASAISSLTANPPSLANDGKYQTEWVASTATWPAWWMTDLGSPKPIQEVDISWFMYKGSEAYYQYTIDYSNDGVNFKSIDKTDNQLYGFTSDAVNITARYVRITLQNAVLWNNPNNWYTPQLWEVSLLKAPQGRQIPVKVQASASASSISIDSPVTINATVTTPSACVPLSGTVALSGGGYTSQPLALIPATATTSENEDDSRTDHPEDRGSHNGQCDQRLTGTASFTVPSGVLVPGEDAMVVTYMPGLLSSWAYRTSTGQTQVKVNGGGPDGGYIIPNGTYTFVNRNSGLYMDDPDSSTTLGTGIDQATASSGTNQQWQVTNLGDNILKITNVASALVVDMTGWSASNGGVVDEWSWNGGANQEWKVISLGGGLYELTNVNSGLALEVPGSSVTSGTVLDQWTWNGGANQQWIIHSVPTE